MAHRQQIVGASRLGDCPARADVGDGVGAGVGVGVGVSVRSKKESRDKPGPVH